MKSLEFSDETAILISGEAGQGLNTMESILCRIVQRHGLCILAAKEIMSRIRGGLNSTLLRVSKQPRAAFRRTPDLVISMQSGGLERLADRLGENTMVFFDSNLESAPSRGHAIPIDLKEIAGLAGGKLYTGVAICGMVCAFLGIPEEACRPEIETFFANKKPRENLAAFAAGHAMGCQLADARRLDVALQPGHPVANRLLMSGSQAVGAGALAGGLNFIASYPMSPSTAVLTFLARHADAFGILVEQAEDEIAAINMALGAWFAGARAMVTTSGGGFALMEEGVSLAGITETPCVIHLAQRPGPGTGLPTRTEQGDLNLALYAGHGDVPRIIYAPGSVKQAFALTRKAFAMADRYQIPVFVLTDQFLMDSTWTEDGLRYDGQAPERFTVEGDRDYRRYALTDSGVSPRGVPGACRGWVRVDSDEHDTRGEITEDFKVRTEQVDKRMRKLRDLPEDDGDLEWMGDAECRVVLVTWGSNAGLGAELVEHCNDPSVGSLHFSRVYPIPQQGLDRLRKADTIITIENNYAGQFSALLSAAGIRIHERILQYNGLPFAVEDVYRTLQRLLNGEKS